MDRFDPVTGRMHCVDAILNAGTWDGEDVFPGAGLAISDPKLRMARSDPKLRMARRDPS